MKERIVVSSPVNRGVVDDGGKLSFKVAIAGRGFNKIIRVVLDVDDDPQTMRDQYEASLHEALRAEGIKRATIIREDEVFGTPAMVVQRETVSRGVVAALVALNAISGALGALAVIFFG